MTVLSVSSKQAQKIEKEDRNVINPELCFKSRHKNIKRTDEDFYLIAFYKLEFTV